MTCKKARKNIPLLAGGELLERKARRLSRHLEECESCRKELHEFRAVLASLKLFAREGEQDWEEEEWQSLMQKVTAEKPAPRGLPLGFSIRTGWAYGFLVFLVLGLAAIFFRTMLSHRKSLEAGENITLTQAQPSRRFKPEDSAVPRVEDAPFAARAPKQKRPRAEPALQAALPEKVPAQERLNMTLISKVSGLRVHWTFDKNFEWKETGR